MKDGSEILDIYERKIPACFTFKYKGITISYSQVFNPSNIMLIKNGHFLTEKKFYSVEEAIEHINSLVPNK